MGCATCSKNNGSGLPSGCRNNGWCASGGCNKLEVFNWLAGMELPSGQKSFDCVEIRFKNTRKEYYRNESNLELHVGDIVAVEATSGHDIGAVTLTGELVRLQMNKRKVDPSSREIKKVYRKARESDIDKWKDAQKREHETMLEARKTAAEMKLTMKIGDVEYQGDGTKAMFYYTADERIDFRELIKVLADKFKVRIEMRQIGSRQEAGRIGGIGSCGRELCCSTWLTDFRTVSTSAARYQQLALNPIKLAGQCGKLKCCLNYELDSYLDALKDFPKTDKLLKTEKGDAFHLKTDIFKRTIWYAYKDVPDKFIPLQVDRVKEILNMNQQGEKPFELNDFVEVEQKPKLGFENVVGQDSLTRFDRKKSRRKKNRHRNRRRD
ncbi:MAG: hypothetical protein COA57_04725 [Flavobacteriales bacterium]|nr:MAG: hypothetical protein COA57_04725 [Flavobacteriales bacterium]